MFLRESFEFSKGVKVWPYAELPSDLNRSQSVFYFVPQESHSQAGSTTLTPNVKHVLKKFRKGFNKLVLRQTMYFKTFYLDQNDFFAESREGS